jgi:hypothetical protein
MAAQALYVVDHQGRYCYIWAGSAAEARERAADPVLPVSSGAPHQHPRESGSPRGIEGAAPMRSIGIRTVTRG